MINQEEFYFEILNEDWSSILKKLHKHKNSIQSDTMLSHAVSVFENEFFQKMPHYSMNHPSIVEDLETLFLLFRGRFVTISSENYKKLVMEITKRKPLDEAVKYANLFPDEELSKQILGSSKKDNISSEKENHSLIITKTGFTEIFNRIFELINNQNDAATYFSGPRFISVVKESEPYFPDYNQYIEQRNSEGKSTSRKIFFYDILNSLNERSRLISVLRIIDIVQPFHAEKVEYIKSLLGIQNFQSGGETILVNYSRNQQKPKIFISYSWDDEPHKKWVLDLANRLCNDGIDVTLDRYYLRLGRNLIHFIENSISESQKILIIFTPNYKLKADKRSGGVGYEYSIMNSELYNQQVSNEKIIPILRTGNSKDSIPAFMQQFIHLDIRDDSKFENSYNDLLREIYDEPAIQKPTLGEKPSF